MKMTALRGNDLGWSVIPVKLDKKPYFKWEEYQKSSPSTNTLSDWRKEYNPPAWAVVTGEVSGVIVLDFDGDTGATTMRALGLSPHVQTPSGGFHVYFRHPGFAVKTVNGKSKTELGRRYPSMDIRADGGYAVFCGCNVEGKYQWLREPEPEPISTLPSDLRVFLGLDKPVANHSGDRLLEAAIVQSASGRNDAGFWLACQLRDDGMTRSEAKAIMLQYQGGVSGMNAKGCVEEYTVDEAMASLDQAFAVPAREPSGREEIVRVGRPVDETAESEAENVPLIRAKQWPDPPTQEAYYGLAGNVVRALGPHTEADPVALLSSFLVAFGNVIGRSAHFVAEADRHYLNLFGVLVGESAKGRKGVSFGRVKQMIGEVDDDWMSFRIQSGLSSGEGLIWAVRDAIEKQEPIRDKGTITGYQAVIVDPGVTDKRLLCMESELASVLRVLSREGNTLSAIIRNAWDTGDLTSLTKNSPARATGAHISVIGHITRDELLRYLESTEAGNGFGNRFLWICVKRSKCLPEGGCPNETELTALTERLRRCVSFACTTGRMERDEEARKLWFSVYPELSDGKPGLLGAMIARAEAQVMRLACIYALLDCSNVVRIEHLKAALAFWRYCDDSARYIFGDSLGDPIADEVLRALRERPDGMTRTEISNHFGRHKSSSEIGRALVALLERGFVRQEIERPPEGRPVERWFAVKPDRIPYMTSEICENSEIGDHEVGDNSPDSLSSQPTDAADHAGVAKDDPDGWVEV